MIRPGRLAAIEGTVGRFLPDIHVPFVANITSPP